MPSTGRARWVAAGLLALLAAPGVMSQYPPDLGPFTEPLDELLGEVVPPAINTTYAILGQNITREDIRLFADINITKGTADVPGLALGSGPLEFHANVDLGVEFRVIYE